jgi:hypothetical protein
VVGRATGGGAGEFQSEMFIKCNIKYNKKQYKIQNKQVL